MDTIIPLFPLHIVVYPNSYYPLHIFEERYKKLVLHAMRYNTSFGISPMLNNQIKPVGTAVQVVEKLHEYANGEFDIIVKGLHRYTINRWWMHDMGYAEALIRPLDDESQPISPEMIVTLEYKFRETLDKVQLTLDEKFWVNFYHAELKSFKAAEKSGLPLEQQIKLLETRTENERITQLLSHYHNIIEYQQQKQAAMKIAMNDGYINV